MTLLSCVVYIKKTYQAELKKSRFFNGGVYCIAQAVQSNVNNDRISETFLGAWAFTKVATFSSLGVTPSLLRPCPKKVKFG